MNALANPEVGKYLNEYFVSSFQKVATFKIVGGQKQGGNVASYFCAPDGRVLHVVAGPVDAGDAAARGEVGGRTPPSRAIEDSKGDGAEFKAIFRKAHADQLQQEHGLVVEPVTYDPPDGAGPEQRPDLPRPDGPAAGPEAAAAADRRAGRVVPRPDSRPPTGRRPPGRGAVHGPRAAGAGCWATRAASTCCWRRTRWRRSRSCTASVFEGILGEKISTKPVEVVTPFPWHRHARAGG